MKKQTVMVTLRIQGVWEKEQNVKGMLFISRMFGKLKEDMEKLRMSEVWEKNNRESV